MVEEGLIKVFGHNFGALSDDHDERRAKKNRGFHHNAQDGGGWVGRLVWPGEVISAA